MHLSRILVIITKVLDSFLICKIKDPLILYNYLDYIERIYFNYIILYNYLKETNFDFDRCRYRTNQREIYIDAFYIPENESCPSCGSTSLYKNGHVKKTVKHCTYYTRLINVICHIQCYKCKDCKTIFRERDTFSYPNETLSKESIFAILDKLKMPNNTFESIARDLHISRQNVIDIFDRYIDYSAPSKLPEIMCFDEKHINKRMTDSVYLFIIIDFKTIEIYDIVHSRHKITLERYFSKYPIEERQKVKYIVMDMWEPYLDVAKRYFKNAKIAIDSFHIMESINNAMNRVRLSVMQKYNLNTENLNDNDPYYYVLKKYRYYLTKEFDDITDKSFYNKKLRMRLDKHSLRKYIFSIDDRLEIAYRLTERYREFNKTCSINEAEKELDDIIESFFESKLPSFIEVAKTLSHWKE